MACHPFRRLHLALRSMTVIRQFQHSRLGRICCLTSDEIRSPKQQPYLERTWCASVHKERRSLVEAVS